MKETFYFSHDYNARADGKIKKLLSIHGMPGYGVFWAIIEDLYQNANAMRTDYGCIAYDLRVQEPLIKSIIEDFDLFEIEGDFFGSSSVKRRLYERTEKSRKARESALSRWSKEEEKEEENANALRSHCDSNAIKESILKDNKVKENKLKRKNITSPPSTEVDIVSKKPIPKNTSIVDEKELEKQKQQKRFSRLAEILYDFIQDAKQIKLPKTRIQNWARDLSLLHSVDGVDYARQKKALDWYQDHYKEPYIPVIECGSSFRGKFIKLEAAMQRTSIPKKNSNYTLGHLSKDRQKHKEPIVWSEDYVDGVNRPAGLFEA